MHRSDPSDPASARPSECAETDTGEFKRRMRECALLAPAAAGVDRTMHASQPLMADSHLVHGGQDYRICHYGEPHTAPGDAAELVGIRAPCASGRPGALRNVNIVDVQHATDEPLQAVRDSPLLLTYAANLPLDGLMQAAVARLRLPKQATQFYIHWGDDTKSSNSVHATDTLDGLFASAGRELPNVLAGGVAVTLYAFELVELQVLKAADAPSAAQLEAQLLRLSHADADWNAALAPGASFVHWNIPPRVPLARLMQRTASQFGM
eukprot:2899720-Prymnesium_polylepis.1